MIVAAILAGGIGSRFGAERPKQFVEVLGKPILAYTIEFFEHNPKINAIEVMCHKLWKPFLELMISEYGYEKVKWTADGGETFQ